VAATDGTLTFVDLGRWDLPSQVGVYASVRAAVTSARPAGTIGNQWLVLSKGGTTALHTDPTGLSTAVTVTGGFTPSDRWFVTSEGILPNLSSRRAEAGDDAGTPWLALQQTAADGTGQAAVRLFDPTLGVHVGDTVVIDPVGLGTCGQFEASVLDVAVPDTARPGGFVHLGPRTTVNPVNPTWNACLELLRTSARPGSAPFFAATIRASGYVLVRGIGTAALHVGRPDLLAPFQVAWQDEGALAAACTLPPAVPWPGVAAGCGSGTPCRASCETLQAVRLARRLSYVREPPVDQTGPAIGFTLALEAPGAVVPRDLSLEIDTAEGRQPFRTGPTTGSPTDARAVVPYDRSPWIPGAGTRYLVPYAGGVFMDATPVVPGGGIAVIN
jgi:hypothetical protein